MNARLTELYRACRPEGALKSQDQFGSANVLLGTEVDNFALKIIEECAKIAAGGWADAEHQIRKHFEINE